MTYTKKTSSVYRGILNLVNYRAGGLPDWRSGARITADLNPEDHHIYPRAFLTRSQQEDLDSRTVEELADCVVNRTLMPKLTNIRVSDRAPSAYLSDLAKINEHLAACLGKHLIDVEMIEERGYDTLFEIFLEGRAERIFDEMCQEVHSKLEKMRQQFGRAVDVGPQLASRRIALKELMERGFIMPGDRLYVQKAPAELAELLDHEQVSYRGELMSIQKWAQKVTGWPTINIYDRVFVSRNHQRLGDLRAELLSGGTI